MPWASGVLAMPAWAEGATQHKSVEWGLWGLAAYVQSPASSPPSSVLLSKLHDLLAPPFVLRWNKVMLIPTSQNRIK